MVAVAAVVSGLLFGFLDFVWIKFVPYPFAELGNSSAVWAVAAFAFGYWVHSGWVRAALGAITLLVIAVPSYSLADALIQKGDPANMWAPTSLLWMLFGILAGAVFGIAGVWARDAGWRQTVGVAMASAVLFAGAASWARRIGSPSYGDDTMWSVVIHAVLGALVIVLAARTARRRAAALAATLPLALLGFVGFSLAGFG